MRSALWDIEMPVQRLLAVMTTSGFGEFDSYSRNKTNLQSLYACTCDMGYPKHKFNPDCGIGITSLE